MLSATHARQCRGRRRVTRRNRPHAVARKACFDGGRHPMARGTPGGTTILFLPYHPRS
jgi:hypothetical protein